MEKNAPNPTPEQEVQQTDDLLAKAKSNSKLILGLSVFILVVIVAILIWFFVSKNGSARADEAVGRADLEQNDSVALERYREAAEHGYKSGNRAKLEVAMRLYEAGNYSEALDYLKDASIDDKVVAAGALTLEGDCYVNLEEYDNAIKAYQKAVKKADKNPQIVPVILIKEANVYREQANYAEEAKALKTIIDEYPMYVQSSQVDVKKLYERAKDSRK